MTFANPHYLWLLLALPPALILFFWWSWRQRQDLMTQFIHARLLPALIAGVSPARQKLRAACLVLAVVALILALAQPQWGYDLEEVRQRGLDIIVAVDTSKSMLAEDIAPNRLERAKLAALDLMQQAKSDRLGLVAFAGTAFLQCPLTFDDDAFRQSLQALDVNTIPEGGTALAAAITEAQKTLKEGDNYRVLVLFTDGEDHDSGALEAAKSAAAASLRIFTIGIGTAEGDLLRVKGADGQSDYIRDKNGNVVKSRLDESLLQQIAGAAGGFYLPLRGARTIDTLYQKGLAPLPKSEAKERWVRHPHERYHWPLALGITLLIIEILLPERKMGRHNHPHAGLQTEIRTPRDPVGEQDFSAPQSAGAPVSQTHGEPNERDAAVAPASPEHGGSGKGFSVSPGQRAGVRATVISRLSLGFGPSTAATTLALMLLPALAFASSSSALREYQSGNYVESLKEYERALEKKGDDPRLHFNAGGAAYRHRQFDRAAKHFDQVLGAPDLKLQEQAYYNLGNALYRLGEQNPDPEKKAASWEESLKQYESSLKLDARDADAKFNYEFVKQQLEELKKQRQQQQQQENQKRNQDQNQKQNQDRKQNQNQNQGQKDQQQNSQSQQQQQQQQNPSEQKQAGNQREPEPKQPQPQPAQKSPGGEKEQPQPNQEKEQKQAYAAGEMTPQEAQQLLDSQKNDDLMLPVSRKQKAVDQERPVKDW
jgi:Ca-activated chloride channel family protein